MSRKLSLHALLFSSPMFSDSYFAAIVRSSIEAVSAIKIQLEKYYSISSIRHLNGTIAFFVVLVVRLSKK